MFWMTICKEHKNAFYTYFGSVECKKLTGDLLLPLFQAVLRNKTGILTFFLSLSQENTGSSSTSTHTTVSD